MSPHQMKHRWPLAFAAAAVCLLILMVFARQPSRHSVEPVEPQLTGQETDLPAALELPRLDDLDEATGARVSTAGDTPTAYEIEQRLSSADPKLRNQAVELFFSALAARDPAAAARIVNSIADADLRSRLLRIVARNWAEREPSEALDWARMLAGAEERDTAVAEIFSHISASDPAEAVRLRQWFSSEQAVDSELANLAQRWAEQDLPAALQWADSLGVDEQRNLIIARAAFVQAQRSPVEATRWVTSRIPEGPARTEVLISVLHQWAQRDAAAAADWASQLPPGPLHDRAAAELEAITSTRQHNSHH